MILVSHVRKLDLVSIVIIVAVFSVFALSGTTLYRSIEQGRETHKALCSYKADTQKRYDDSQKYLLMTPAQREAKYGKQLANIPAATIKRSLVAQKSILDSLRFLGCD